MGPIIIRPIYLFILLYDYIQFVYIQLLLGNSLQLGYLSQIINSVSIGGKLFFGGEIS